MSDLSANAARRKVVISASTRNERALRAAIEVHCPERDEMRMAARVELALIRDQSSAAIAKASDGAAVLLGEVCHVATQAVYANVATSKLLRIRMALLLTVDAARALEFAMR